MPWVSRLRQLDLLKIEDEFTDFPCFMAWYHEIKLLSKEKVLLKFDKLSKIGLYKEDIILYFLEKIETKEV